MKHLIQINSKSELIPSAEKFLDILKESKEKKIAFSGEMGAGKTTFISSLIKVMGVEQDASSPTFSIVDEYQSEEYGTINHFDFYRIENDEEIYDIGIEEYLENDSFCFMEWPEKVKNVLSNQCLWVNLSESHGIRLLEFDL
jgi:tRNA threonylcarbamoyladenosine biosynthesis protein TsaE